MEKRDAAGFPSFVSRLSKSSRVLKEDEKQFGSRVHSKMRTVRPSDRLSDVRIRSVADPHPPLLQLLMRFNEFRDDDSFFAHRRSSCHSRFLFLFPMCFLFSLFSYTHVLYKQQGVEAVEVVAV